MCSPVLSRWRERKILSPNCLTTHHVDIRCDSHEIQSTFVRRSCNSPLAGIFSSCAAASFLVVNFFFRSGCIFATDVGGINTRPIHTRAHVSWCATTHTKSFLSPSSQSSCGCLLVERKKTQNTPSFHIIVAEQTSIPYSPTTNDNNQSNRSVSQQQPQTTTIILYLSNASIHRTYKNGSKSHTENAQTFHNNIIFFKSKKSTTTPHIFWRKPTTTTA